MSWDEFVSLTGSIALGVIGGKVILSMLGKRCEYCGHQFKENEIVCPVCFNRNAGI